MNDQTKFLGLFKTQLSDFCDDLSNQFPAEAELSIFRFVVDQIPIKALVEGFHRHSNRPAGNGLMRDMIRDRDADFFIKERPFGFVSESRNDMMTTYWGLMDDDARLSMWAWFDLFIRIADKACL